MNSQDLDALISWELRRLPSPHAPDTLLPRVMAAVQAWTLRPWYERAWFTWPLGWQMTSAAALILMIAGGGMLLPGAQAAAVAAASAMAAPSLGEVTAAAGRAAQAASAAAVLWRALFEPFLPYVFGLALLMCLACAAFGAALSHVAFGRSSQG